MAMKLIRQNQVDDQQSTSVQLNSIEGIGNELRITDFVPVTTWEPLNPLCFVSFAIWGSYN